MKGITILQAKLAELDIRLLEIHDFSVISKKGARQDLSCLDIVSVLDIRVAARSF